MNRTRRNILLGTAAAGTAAIVLPQALAWAGNSKIRYPFTLGVASGEPTPDGIVLWTRLAPKPFEADAGMPSRDVEVEWEIAKDEGFRKVARRGKDVAWQVHGHSVHVELGGLEPHTWYWYRFKVDGHVSPVGRTRTAPAPGTSPEFRFGFASCASYEYGYYTAYQRMAEEDFDLIVFLGDYIYEYGVETNHVRQNYAPPYPCMSVEDYRMRFAQQKVEPEVQQVHAAAPWLPTWDDHELLNDYANMYSPYAWTDEEFALRRRNAYRAYYENMPLRKSTLPHGIDMRIYRSLDYGDLARFVVLDTRQYRDPQACRGGIKTCADAADPARRFLGNDQEQWVYGQLDSSPARWNVLAQQVFLSAIDESAGTAQSFSMDSWSGYSATRDRLLSHIQATGTSNPIVLTGDVHAHYVSDIKANFNDPGSASIGAEFVVTSITSETDGADARSTWPLLQQENPHLKYHSFRRGYGATTVGKDTLTTEMKILPYVSTKGAPVSTGATFVVENGVGGVVRA